MKINKWAILVIGIVAIIAVILSAVIFKLEIQTVLYILTFLFLIIGVPYLVVSFIKYSKSKKIEERFPDFLRDLTESVKAGMTIPQAIENATKTEYGELSKWIKKMNYMLSWGVPFPDTIKKMRDEIKHAPYIKRGMSIILQSYYSGGDVATTMYSIAQATTELQNVEKDRVSILKQQVMIVYVIHFIFIGIIISVYLVLIPMISTKPTEGGFISFGTPPSYSYFKILFFVTIMVQSVSNALVAGETMDGTLIAGVKHLMVMLPVGIIAYLMFIYPPKFDIKLSVSKTELLPSEKFTVRGNIMYEGEVVPELVVTARLGEQEKQALSDENGDFEVELTALPVEGMQEIIIYTKYDEHEKTEIKEIYVS